MNEQTILDLLSKGGADVFIVAVTCVLVFAGYYVLPGPRDKNGERIMKVNPPWDSVLFIAPFAIGMILALALDQFTGANRFCTEAVKRGLATGSYAMVVERGVFMLLRKKIQDAQP